MRNAEDRLNAYIQTLEKTRSLSERITTFVADYSKVAPDDVAWSTVGNLRYVHELLQQAVFFIDGEPDDECDAAAARRDYEEMARLGAGQPPVTWGESQLANEVAQLRAELTQLQADLRRYTHCAYCGERLGDYHQCAYTLAFEDNATAAMRACTLEQRQRQEDREATR